MMLQRKSEIAGQVGYKAGRLTVPQPGRGKPSRVTAHVHDQHALNLSADLFERAPHGAHCLKPPGDRYHRVGEKMAEIEVVEFSVAAQITLQVRAHQFFKAQRSIHRITSVTVQAGASFVEQQIEQLDSQPDHILDETEKHGSGGPSLECFDGLAPRHLQGEGGKLL